VSTVVDANVVIAWQNPDHAFHRVATQLIQDEEPPLFMSQLNLAEVLIGLDRQQWTDFIEALAGVGFVICDLDAVAIATARIDSRLRMPDAHVIATAQTQAADRVVSFDAAVVQAAQSLGFATNRL
jgi:predicted nucleic acid-binding protein